MERWFFNRRLRAFFRSLVVILNTPRVTRLAFRVLRSLSSRKESARPSFETLDILVDEAGSVERLLDSPALYEKYYQSLQSYFGRDRFNRRAFDSITKQLRSLLTQVPALRERVERRESLGRDFDLPTNGKTSGRDLDLSLWRLYRFEWLGRLRRSAGLAANDANCAEIIDQAARFVEEIELRRKCFLLEMSRLKGEAASFSRKDEIELRSNFFKKLKQDSRIERFSAFLLYSFLTDESNKFFLQLSDADLILDFLDSARRNPRVIVKKLIGIDSSDLIEKKIRSLIPSTKELLQDREIFPIRFTSTLRGKALVGGPTQSANYRTRFIRPFHAIWLGIPHNDCLGGDPAFLSSITAARWAVALLKDAETFIIEKNESYAGYGRCVPLLEKSGKIRTSLELWSPLMLANVLFGPNPGSRRTSVCFFDIWFPKLVRHLPENLKSIVISESKIVDNAGLKLSLTYSPHFWISPQSMDPRELLHIDPLASVIQQNGAKSALGEKYRGDMILDAMMCDAGRIHLLKPFEVSAQRISEALERLESLPAVSQRRLENYLGTATDSGLLSEALFQALRARQELPEKDRSKMQRSWSPSNDLNSELFL